MLQGRRCLRSLPTGTSDQCLSDLWAGSGYSWITTERILLMCFQVWRLWAGFQSLNWAWSTSIRVFFLQFGWSCSDTLFVYLWSDSSCEVPSLNAKHLWNMGHFVVQVDLPWILCSLCLVIMISKFYHSPDFYEHDLYLNRVHEDELSSQIQ